jgi:hypothetical protein
MTTSLRRRMMTLDPQVGGVMTTQAEIFERGREIVLASPSLYVDVDVEADGIAGYGSMRAIGAQACTGESFFSEIQPYESKFLLGHAEFCEHHGLPRERLLREAPPLEVVMTDFATWVVELMERYAKPAVFTGFNAGFDFAHVDLGFVLSGIENPFGIAAFDIKSLAIAITPTWNWRETSKSRLPDAILPDQIFTHDPLDDARYQQHIPYALVGQICMRKSD